MLSQPDVAEFVNRMNPDSIAKSNFLFIWSRTEISLTAGDKPQDAKNNYSH
jgi:hypothetical protein